MLLLFAERRLALSEDRSAHSRNDSVADLEEQWMVKTSRSNIAQPRWPVGHARVANFFDMAASWFNGLPLRVLSPILTPSQDAAS